jgi:hypothetical protein
MLRLNFTSAGASIGGLIFPIAINRLFASSSFAYTVRASMFIVVGFLGLANALMSSPMPVHRADPPMKAILRDKSYWFLTFGCEPFPPKKSWADSRPGHCAFSVEYSSLVSTLYTTMSSPNLHTSLRFLPTAFLHSARCRSGYRILWCP